MADVTPALVVVLDDVLRFLPAREVLLITNRELRTCVQAALADLRAEERAASAEVLARSHHGQRAIELVARGDYGARLHRAIRLHRAARYEEDENGGGAADDTGSADDDDDDDDDGFISDAEEWEDMHGHGPLHGGGGVVGGGGGGGGGIVIPNLDVYNHGDGPGGDDDDDSDDDDSDRSSNSSSSRSSPRPVIPLSDTLIATSREIRALITLPEPPLRALELT